jgi:hypothetical protein
MTNFKNIDYLKSGNKRQKEAYLLLKTLKIFESLKKYNPILVGTIPIEIDIPESDLDIICQFEDQDEFSQRLVEIFGKNESFSLNSKYFNGILSIIAKFDAANFKIEIFGQNIPTEHQNAYKHMLIENKVLLEKGEEFKAAIVNLKQKGLKTEAAFSELLGLAGDPYKALLNI